MTQFIGSLNFDAQGPHSAQAYNTVRPSVGTAHVPNMPVPDLTLSGDYVVEEPKIQLTAGYLPGVNDSFYNRILIEPSRLEMGNLLSNQTRFVTLWNGFLYNSNLEAVDRFNDPGIALDQPVETPYVLRPLEQLTYVFSITTDGPAVINAHYEWLVDGVVYRAEVVGRRVVLFPYGPNWSTPVTEGLEWMTDVLRSYSGKEQRRSLRTTARRSLSYRMTVTREEAARFENLLWGWQNRTYAVPVWTDKPRLQTNQLQGDILLNLPTANFSFTPNGLAVVFDSERNFEVVEIDTVGGTNLILKRPLERPWLKGTIVYPCLLGHLPTNVATTRLTSNALAASISFDFNPADTDPNLPTGNAPVVYDGLEVITKQPNWVSSLQNDFEYQFATLDQRTGAIEWDTTEEFPRIARKYSWLLKNRNEISDFRRMLRRRHGQLNALRVPTWHDDFIVNQVIGASDTAISVNDNEFRSLVGINPARDRIMIRLRNGQVFYRRLIGLSANPSGVLLTMDNSLGIQVEADQVHMIHLLMRSRLATDRVEIVWRSNEVATVETTFTSVLE